MPLISVVNYGVGNLRSVKRGLEKSGARVLVTNNPKGLDKSDAIVLPGVGAFGSAMKNLAPLSYVLTQSMESGKFIFGICLGLQLFFTRSSEGGLTKGFGFISGDVMKLPESVKLPQIGWNTIEIRHSHPFLSGIQGNSYFYFVHSYVSQPLDQSVVMATTDYGIEFPSVIAKKNVFATQFHPEKSSNAGLTILKNFIKTVKR